MTLKLFIYPLTCLCFSIILGAGIYEHVAVWPRAYAAPPKSLGMFQGAYGLNAGAFWKVIHPITILLFAFTLIVWWKTPRRNYIMIPFAAYIIILIITFAYFVPELIRITGAVYNDTVDEALQKRGSLWTTLSLIRAFILSILVIILYWGLTKPEIANASN